MDRNELVRELANNPSGVWVTCASPSMEPSIAVGQKVRIVAAGKVRMGDVVLFETADALALVLHRVVLAPPGTSWIAHVGDSSSPLAAAVFPRERLIGVAADIARKRPSPVALAVASALLARRQLSALWRRSRAKSD